MTETSITGASGAMRFDRDPLGEVCLPAARLYGPQTARAITNFPLSGRTLEEIPLLLQALAQVKKAAALTNAANAELPTSIVAAIVQACDEIIAGQWHEEFAVDVYQGGAGTSTNMNMNEVLANRALAILGKPCGLYEIVNPNDHVNKSQSTNDAYATAVRLTVYKLNGKLVVALRKLAEAMQSKAAEFVDVAKLGRTQLQDAVPMTLGQEFGAFATTLLEDVERAEEVAALFLEVNLGGTAIGTSVGASAAYGACIVDRLREVTGLEVVRATNLIEATWDMGAFVLYSGMLKRIASKLSKIANDLRLLASGPRGGLAEIRLPRRQPGSSLMPGKVNPVIPEALNQIAFRVFGADTTVTFAAEAGQLQLNAFEPVIIWSICESVDLLVAGMDMFAKYCIRGIEADAAVCQRHLLDSTALATALVPIVGYARAAELAKAALANGTDLRAAALASEPDLIEVIDRLAQMPAPAR